MKKIPLGFAAISVRSMEDSVAFYRDVVGFDVLGRGVAGPGVAALLGLPPDTAVEAARLGACGLGIGQILLFAADIPDRQPARRAGDRTTYGLWNVNFYVDDIDAVTEALRDRFEFWSEPKRYVLSEAAGEPIEVVFDGPDGVAINLVQPTGDERTFVGRIKQAADAFGRTRTGFTPVATTAHCVRSVASARAFYTAILNSDIVLDEMLGHPEVNQFLARPSDAVGHAVFLAGDHFFGKLALNEPLNYEVPDRVRDARADAVGYMAQGFFVPDLPAALEASGAHGGELTAIGSMALPGFSGEPAALVRAPGSGALAWLVEGGD